MSPWVYPLLSLMTTVVGAAVTYGMLKATVGTLKVEVAKLKELLDTHHDTFANFREEVRVRLAVQEERRNGRIKRSNGR